MTDARSAGSRPAGSPPAFDPATFDPTALGAEIARRVGVKAERDAPLARFTTMRVGGVADLLVTAHNTFELRALVRFARSRGLPLTLLGRGSDVVISDRGIRGLVVHVRAEATRIEGRTYRAEAGVPMARAATETQGAGLSGLEFGLAIPGSVGGAVWANAGAHGADVASVIESADVLLADGSERRLEPDEMAFAYRDSRFKVSSGATESGAASSGAAPSGAESSHAAEIVLGATFRLEPADAATIKTRLDEIRRWRQTHQPLGVPSAGSTFRNPPEGPSAGELIDRAGLKGLRIGLARVSEKHANFVVTERGATAADVRRVIDRVRATIRERDGVDLRLEIELLGDWAGWPWPADGPAAEDAPPGPQRGGE